MSRYTPAAVLLAAAALAGCQGAAPTTRNFSHLRVPGTPKEAAYDAAYAALAARFPVATSDRVTGTITSEPVETYEPTAEGEAAPVAAGPRRLRRSAIVRVTDGDAAAEVWCKVLVERQDAEAAQMFRNDLGINDAPTGTAVDRDAATTPEQNEVWRVLRRDKLEERAVLRDVEAALNPARGG